jgi:hypothetical protein
MFVSVAMHTAKHKLDYLHATSQNMTDAKGQKVSANSAQLLSITEQYRVLQSAVTCLIYASTIFVPYSFLYIRSVSGARIVQSV